MGTDRCSTGSAVKAASGRVPHCVLPADVHPGRLQGLAQVVESLPSTWETKVIVGIWESDPAGGSLFCLSHKENRIVLKLEEGIVSVFTIYKNDKCLRALICLLWFEHDSMYICLESLHRTP